jgi:hypothetical protein
LNSVNALVQHGDYQIQGRLVWFVRTDLAEQNHRAALGFIRGWLMFLGMQPDYRNDTDIANVVAAFGQYHYWNNLDQSNTTRKRAPKDVFAMMLSTSSLRLS